jgi:hypothetical protein
MDIRPAISPTGQLPMYGVSEELAPRIAKFGLERNLQELQEQGYTVIPVDRELTDRLRLAIFAATESAKEGNSTFDRACGMPLGLDPVFGEACEHPAVLAIAEFMCGRGYVLSALLATVRTAGSAIQLHSDQAWLPSPYPEHNAFMTACWVTDDFTRENGATCVVPGSHLLRRAPSPEESAARFAEAVAIEAPAGSVAIWDGSVWHGNIPRTAPGERAVLHVSYGRVGYQRFHDFSYVGEEFRNSASATMRGLLGENLGFQTNSMHEHFDPVKYGRMTANIGR